VEYDLPVASSSPIGITAGPDGNLWFTENTGARVGRITLNGEITEFAGLSGAPYGIASGADGNLWFTEAPGYQIGRITPSGTVTEFLARGIDQVPRPP
jgi:virginiamycin B lyase